MHTPVLLQETLAYLNARQGQKFIDGTAGSGGHSWGIIKLNPQARVLAIDRDPAAELQSNERITMVRGNYADIDRIAAAEGFWQADGVILDLGFSSVQVDDASRGFTFQQSGPLDMRFDPSQSLTADEVVNRYPEDRLARIFKQYGEEPLARRIASKIVAQRRLVSLVNTRQLAALIGSPDSARRIFQALRIEVNNELEHLRAALPKILELLRPGGRMVIISFHSLEDRIVKQFLAHQAKGCVCPPDFPSCTCGQSSKLRILTLKPVTASKEELARNSRSRSAKLRAAEKSVDS